MKLNKILCSVALLGVFTTTTAATASQASSNQDGISIKDNKILHRKNKNTIIESPVIKLNNVNVLTPIITVDNHTHEAQIAREAQAKMDAQLKAKKDAERAAQLKELARQQAIIDQQAEAQRQQEIAAQQAAESQAQQQEVQQAPQQSTLPSSGGLDMNQTTGTVDINALANWLATNKGTYSASYWAYIINRESRGNVDAMNPSSGAYGVLQLYGHGEWPGMTLGQQLQMAMPLPASAWYL